MALQLTPEQEDKIKQAIPLLPEGFDIVNTAQLNELRKQKQQLETVFKKLVPVFKTFSPGAGDIISQLPQLMPVIGSLQNDTELSENLNAVIERLK